MSFLSGELAGLTAAVAELIAPLARPGKGELRLGVPESAKAAVAAALAIDHPGPTLLITPSPARAQAMREELAFYVGSLPLVRLPERERLPYEFAPDDPIVSMERSRALAALASSSPALVVCSWAALSEHCAGPGIEASGVDAHIGDSLEPMSLLSRLEEAGYRTVDLADQPGTASRRGGLVDVFPAAAEHPYRIEFFGNEVDSIRRVDLNTQRSVERLDSVHFAVAATATRQARDAAGALVARLEATTDEAEKVTEQLELIASGLRSEYETFFEPLLYGSTALAHLNRAAAILHDDIEEGEAALVKLLEQQERARVELEQRGHIPAELPMLSASVDEVRDALSHFAPPVHLQRFGAEEMGARRLPLRATPSFAGKLKPLVDQAAAWANEGKAVVLASQQALRLAEIMDEAGIKTTLARGLESPPKAGSITLLALAAGGGFILDEHLIFVSDSEIFGFRKRRRPTRTRIGIKSDLISTLEIGDYLVHADHGIARYGGLIRRTVDGIEREYLELQYAEGDRLLVPADQLESVTAYVGPAEHPPSLTRLGSQDWARTKRRVKQAVLALAQDLLDLYAKREVARGHAFAPDKAWQMEMEAAFPFVETTDQLDAINDVKADMENVRPMDRLICGDVGYGKTEVAIRAAFKAVADGKQVAVLVPTTVLAEQHGNTFRERMAGFPVRVEVLSRFRSEHQQRDIARGIREGAVDIAIGTHRLLQKDIQFKDLGLVIIDEEQRFGVVHKERLKQMREEVDTLTLSATPIPRTLQMSLSGIRDMSTIMTPPEERLPIRTYVLQWDDEIIREAIDRELQRGGQVYFVHNRVHNIERIVSRLRDLVPEAELTVGHGQMPEEQLERVMMEFSAGDQDVLVCTTIIESGLDIPNVNTIIINDADRLGLAQLYQLRGRVGRSANRAYAYILYDKDRS
ncbi:MAG TPA: transcription-repair coupling factor, partial [Tepidiformaceae bacterium]